MLLSTKQLRNLQIKNDKICFYFNENYDHFKSILEDCFDDVEQIITKYDENSLLNKNSEIEEMQFSKDLKSALIMTLFIENQEDEKLKYFQQLINLNIFDGVFWGV